MIFWYFFSVSRLFLDFLWSLKNFFPVFINCIFQIMDCIFQILNIVHIIHISFDNHHKSRKYYFKVWVFSFSDVDFTLADNFCWASYTHSFTSFHDLDIIHSSIRNASESTLLLDCLQALRCKSLLCIPIVVMAIFCW